MKFTLITITFILSNLLTHAQSEKYYNHLIFRETPYSKTEGRIQLSEERSESKNHYKLTYDTSNRLVLIEYLYQNKLIELNRSGLLDGKRALAPKTQIEYIDKEEIRTFFGLDGQSTSNGMGVFKEVYSYNEAGKRVGLKFFDKDDKPINNSWQISEYVWKHIDGNSLLETRKDISGTNVSLRPYYKFYNVLYKFNDDGLLLSMNNVDEELNLVNDETGVASDKAVYDEDNNLVRFKFFNAESEPAIGIFLGTGGGFASYDKDGNCLKYATIDLDGNYMVDKRSNEAYSRYEFDTLGNLIERSSYDTNATILTRRGVTRVKYVYNQDNPIELLKTELHHTTPIKTPKDSILERSNTLIAKGELLEDYDQLLETLDQHPSPFEFIDEASFTNLVNTQKDKLTDSMSVKDFYQVISPLVSSLGCLHTRVVDDRFFRIPYKYWLPIIVRFEDDKLYAVNNCVENIEMNAGSEILEIDGISAKEIYRILKTTISADAYNESFYKGDLNVNFLYYYHSYFGFNSEYKIKFKPYNSEREIMTTFFINEPNPGYKSKIDNKPRLSLEVRKEDNTAIIKIRNFSYFPRGRENIDFFKEKIDTYAKTINEGDIEKIVFDLRGNRGGNPECSKHLLSYITKQEIGFYADNELNRRRNRPVLVTPQVEANLSSKRIFILTDGRCASATAGMLALVKHKKIATIVGEETGGTYSTNPGRVVAALKNTNLGLQIGTERESVNVPELPLNRGITPDTVINLRVVDIINGQDPLLNHVLKE